MARLAPETQHVDAVAEAPFYIPATAPANRPRRTLKYGDTFIVVDSHGDMGAIGGGSDGLFHSDTRFLSRLELLINGTQPLLLGSNVRDDNTLLAIDLTNPDVFSGQRIVLLKDTLHIVRTMFLWREIAFQRLKVSNHGDCAVKLRLSLHFTSDFADLFEVRGLQRDRRGTLTRKTRGPQPGGAQLSRARRPPKAHRSRLRSGADPSRRKRSALRHRSRSRRGGSDICVHRLRPQA